MADKLAPLRERKCPKCLTPLAAGQPNDGWRTDRACPACEWGRSEPPPDVAPPGCDSGFGTEARSGRVA